MTVPILVFMVMGCNALSEVSTSEPPRDPAGTVSLSVRYDQQPYVFIDQSGKIYTQPNECSGTCTNWSFKMLSTLDMQCNASQSGMPAPAIVDLGEVKGLGAIKDDVKPSLAQAQAINGHGYLLRALFGQSVALYVESDVVGINGGVYGKNIKLAVIGNAGKAENAPAATAKLDGTQVCPLGWSAGLSANASGSTIKVAAKCGETDYVNLDFSPTPAAGGSAPLVDGAISGANAYASCTSSAPSTMAGAVTVSGTTGALMVNGSVRCSYSLYGSAVTHVGTVQFSNVPLTVQP